MGQGSDITWSLEKYDEKITQYLFDIISCEDCGVVCNKIRQMGGLVDMESSAQFFFLPIGFITWLWVGEAGTKTKN